MSLSHELSWGRRMDFAHNGFSHIREKKPQWARSKTISYHFDDYSQSPEPPEEDPFFNSQESKPAQGPLAPWW